MVDFYSDYFTAESLTDAISQKQFIPSRLMETGLFETRFLPGTKLSIEEQPAHAADLMTASSRGTPSKAAVLERRKVHSFETAHYREDGAVYADEVLNMRASGVTAAREVISTRRDEVLTLLRRKLDYTHEALRMAALNTPTNSFGSAPAAAAVGFGASDSAIRTAIHNNVVVAMESALAGIPYTGLHAFCDDTFWVALIESKTIRETYLNQVQAAQLRGNTTDQVVYGGVTWERYRGAGTVAIATGTAKIVPLGVPGLFLQAFAPADTLDTIGAGALGTPYWVQGYPIDGGNRGWHIEAQTNVVMVCTRPTSILTIDLS